MLPEGGDMAVAATEFIRQLTADRSSSEQMSGGLGKGSAFTKRSAAAAPRSRHRPGHQACALAVRRQRLDDKLLLG